MKTTLQFDQYGGLDSIVIDSSCQHSHTSECHAATKQDVIDLEKRIRMQIQDAINALNALSTASDGLSVKVDKLVADTTALIAAVKASGNPVTPELEAAITKAQASATATSAEGDKVDAAVASADAVLPTPAPAAPVL